MSIIGENIKFISRHKLASIVLIYFLIGFIHGTVGFILKPDLHLYLQGRSLIGIFSFYAFYFVLPSLFLWPIDTYFSIIWGGRGASLAWGTVIGLIITGIIIVIFWIKRLLLKNE